MLLSLPRHAVRPGGRDTKFLPFCGALEGLETKAILLPPKSPNLNPQVERFMRSMESECLNRMIFFGENSLRKALAEFSAYSHGERNHQGDDNQVVEPGSEIGPKEGEIQCRERLGGILRYYFREAP
jgi:hypothetical protein